MRKFLIKFSKLIRAFLCYFENLISSSFLFSISVLCLSFLKDLSFSETTKYCILSFTFKFKEFF
ncbi:hypothetical protein LEP1GSC021_4964 [Leptospira noguchii str. 1993005606]|nr:hypothetical protein LEP1GSC021_4964 [Leptospira noguchii str. 1993005606]